MIRNQTVLSSEHLAHFVGGIEQNQPVRGGHGGALAVGLLDDTVDTEQMIVFEVSDTLMIRLHDVEAAVEIANPEAGATA